MAGFYADIHKKLKLINDFYSHFTKTIKLLFRAVSVKKPGQSGHPPSLIRVFAVRMKNHWVF